MGESIRYHNNAKENIWYPCVIDENLKIDLIKFSCDMKIV